jgi:hypothetical protein
MENKDIEFLIPFLTTMPAWSKEPGGGKVYRNPTKRIKKTTKAQRTQAKASRRKNRKK